MALHRNGATPMAELALVWRFLDHKFLKNFWIGIRKDDDDFRL